MCLATGCSAMTTSEPGSPSSLFSSCGEVGKIFFDFSDASIQSAIVVPFRMMFMAVLFRTRHPVVSLIHDARVVGICVVVVIAWQMLCNTCYRSTNGQAC